MHQGIIALQNVAIIVVCSLSIVCKGYILLLSYFLLICACLCWYVVCKNIENTINLFCIEFCIEYFYYHDVLLYTDS